MTYQPSKTWYQLSGRIDPWSYQRLLETMAAMGTTNKSKALRYILRRARPPRKPA